VKRSADLQMQ
jgi:clathrin heavy chain